MSDLLIMITSTIGAVFILIAAYGIVVMPDFYLRLSVTIKAATMGVGLLLLSTAYFFSEFSVTSKVIAIIFFLIITAPVAGHMIARTAYIIGVEKWKGTVLDELEGKYHRTTHASGGQEEIITTLDSIEDAENHDDDQPEKV